MRSNQSGRKVTARVVAPQRIDLGVFQMLDGRALAAEVTKRREGGSNADYLTGGLSSREDATLQRQEILASDPPLFRRLAQLMVRGPVRVEVTEVVLDAEKVPSGAGDTYRGLLQNVGNIAYDANSSQPADRQLAVVLEAEAA